MEEEIMSGQAVSPVPLPHLSHSLGCVSTCTLFPGDLLRFTCFQWQPAYFFKNEPHMPLSHPFPTFPHLFSHVFPFVPPLVFMQSSVSACVPGFLSPVPPLNRLWWQWLATVLGGQECALWLALSTVMTRTGSHLCAPLRIPTSAAQVKVFHQSNFTPRSPRAPASHQEKGS